MHRGAANGAILILDLMRFLSRKCPSMHRFLEGILRVIHFQRDVAHSVAMLADMLRGRVVWREGSGQNEIRLALAQRVRSPPTVAGFEAAIGDLGKTKSLAIEIGCLARVADPEFYVVNAL